MTHISNNKLYINKVVCVCLSFIILLGFPVTYINAEAENIQLVKSSTITVVQPQGSERANLIECYEINGNNYAIARVSGRSETYILDINNPYDVKLVQTLTFYVASPQIIGQKIYYLEGDFIKAREIDNEGRINSAELVSVEVGASDNTRDMKILDNKYLFVSRKNAASGIVVYDITDNCNKVMDIAPTNDAIQTQTPVSIRRFEIKKTANDKYTIYALNRSAFNGAHQYELSILDVDCVEKTKTQRYCGKLDSSSALTNGVVFADIDLLNDNTLILANQYPSRGAEIIDITNPEEPTVKAVVSQEGKYGFSVQRLTDSMFVWGSEHNPMAIYEYSNNQLTLKSSIATDGRVYAVSEYKGFLLVANNDKFNVYSYKPEIVCDNEVELVSFEPKLKGWVNGFNATTDTVKVELDGTLYNAVSTNCSFECSMLGADIGSYTDAKVILYRNNDVIDTKTLTINIVKKDKLEFANVNTSDFVNGDFIFDADIVYNGSSTVSDASVFLCAYAGDKMIDYDYSNIEEFEISGLKVELTDAVNSYIRAFIVDNTTGEILSGVHTQYQSASALPDYSQFIDTDFLGENTLNIKSVPSYINSHIIINIALNSELTTPVLVAVYKNTEESNDSIDYINVVETNASGKTAVKYCFNNSPVEYSDYKVSASALMSKNTLTHTFVQASTELQLLTDIETASEDDIISVLKREPDAKQLLDDILWTKYDNLMPSAKTNILVDICAADFDVAADVSLFINKLIIDAELYQTFSTLTGENAITQIDSAMSTGVLASNSIYSLLTDEQKAAMISGYITNTGLSSKSAIDAAIDEGSKYYWVNGWQYRTVIDTMAIETYGTSVGISQQDVNTYTACDDDTKINIIKAFLLGGPIALDNVGTKFSNAVNQNTSLPTPTPTPTYSGGGGGGSLTTNYEREPVENILPEEIIPEKIPHEKEGMFADVAADAWYYEAVSNLATEKIIEGITETTFCPDRLVTREEFVKMIVSAFSLEADSATTDFTDTSPNRWHYKYIASAQKYGITAGITDTEFGVGTNITREQMAALLYRTLNMLSWTFETEEKSEFTDYTEISSFARDAVVSLYNQGLMSGYGDGCFHPKDYSSRAMAAQMIYNVLQRMEVK